MVSHTQMPQVTIWLLSFPDEHFNPHPLCLVVYYLPEGFIPTVVPHGNSKSNSPFFPTLPSTSKVIQENCLDLGPKAVVTHLESSAGGVVEAGYPGELPRNELQVSNYKRRVPVRVGEDLSVQSDRNELYTVMLQAHLEDGDKQFIRDVKAYPEPAIVLATEQQLHDLERFCCNPLNFSVLTVDPTFSLGDFDITPTTYRHLLLRSKRTDKPPVMLGPTLIHYRKTFSTYKFLASCMISLNRHLEGLRAFGTDGETPLIDAFAREFRCAVHVICFNHVRRNIKEKLHKLMIPDVVQSEILNDIFGWRVESTLLTGLVDSGSIPLFEQKLTHLQAKWKLHDVDDDQGPVTRFCTWFQTYKVEVIRDAMLPHVREQAGLGTPPDHFYTNTSESVNKVIKTKVDYKRNELLQFVNKLHDLVVEQQREAEKAVVGCGKYYIHCSDLEIPQSQWFTMSRDQRRQHLKKFNHAPVVSVVTEHPIPSASLENAAPQMRVGTSRSSESTSISSPVPLSEALSTKLCPLSGKLGLPAEAIAAIAKKAAEIIQTDGAIVNAPGQPGDAKMVISRSGKRPHLVVPKKKGGGLSCDDDCPQYKSAKLCSHVVAAAEYNKQLDRFVASYGTSKKVPKLTALTTAGMPKGRGRKGSKAPAKRRPSVPVQTRVELYPMTPGSTIGLNPSVQVHNVQVSAQQNASLTVSPLYQPTLTSPSTSTSVHPSSFPVPMSSYPPVPMSSYLPMPSTYPSMPISSPYLHMHSTPSLSGMDPTCGGMYPFRLHFISGNISVCNGCKGRYKKLPPPHDLCLQHEEWRTFTPQGSVSSQTRFGNTYYHCNVSCVFAVWPSFVPSSVVIPIEVQACLLPEHKQWLYVNFGVFP